MSTIPNALRIRNALENAIVAGVYAPGERLDPEALEREFDCSRTPIREALVQLESSGLVRVQPKRGTFVASLTPEELAERFEMMAEIEATCCRLAARRISEAELAEFEAIHQRCKEASDAGDVEEYYRQNSLFHHCIYNGTQNAFLAREASRLHAMLQPYRRMQLRVRNRMPRSFAEHDAVVQTIRAGDADAAAQAIYNHVIVQGDRFHDLLAAMRRDAQERSMVAR